MDFVTLSQLNQWIGNCVRQVFPDTYWLTAEMSDVRVNQSSGHCYLEFIEKDEKTGTLIAKARAYIWKNSFQLLKPYFEQSTGQAFVSGIKVLVKVGIDFHELYGYGLTVYDIDPAYTLGDTQRRRLEIISRLEEDGVLDLNRELKLSFTPQRIAIITSSTAAGYEDFLDHLLKNQAGFVFYPKLFPAVMQGERTEASIIAALDKIYLCRELFDVVAIIRGGGATSDLSAFDSYLLASNCAQFPLPVITGIGHERDDTVLDRVAFRRTKTPTAVADFLIDRLSEAYSGLKECRETILDATEEQLTGASGRLQQLMYTLPDKAFALIKQQSADLNLTGVKLQHAVRFMLAQAQENLQKTETYLKLSSPRYILSKGYSLTVKDGKFVKSVGELSEGDRMTTLLADGKVESIVADTVNSTANKSRSDNDPNF